MILYALLTVLYAVTCVIGFKLYFYLQGRNMAQSYNRLNKGIVTYLLFLVFILLEIPFTIFFPFWLNSKLIVFETSKTSLMYLLLFGCFILAVALWFGRKSRPKGF